MAENSKIEWTHHTANLWWGCTKVHTGCDHCYAETLSNRWGNDVWGNDKPRKGIKNVFKDLARYQLLAAKANEMHRVFVGSMMDIFEKPMPVIDEQIDTGQIRNIFFGNIDLGKYPNLLFLLLTKRPSNINKYIPETWKVNPPKNVMFGTSPVDQATADILIPQLSQVAGRKFLSCEPLLGHIDLTKEYPVGKGQVAFGLLMDWVIAGGESGHAARPMHPDWIRSLRNQCQSTETPFFFKQWGEYLPQMDGKPWGSLGYKVISIPPEMNAPKQPYIKCGKKMAGHILDGQEYHNFPK